MMSQAGYIYAIGAIGTSYVKIGSTQESVPNQLQQLQIGHHLPLTILATVRVDRDPQQLEKAVHRLLEAHHQHGEWFALVIDQDRLEALVEQAALIPQAMTLHSERLQRL